MRYVPDVARDFPIHAEHAEDVLRALMSGRKRRRTGFRDALRALVGRGRGLWDCFVLQVVWDGFEGKRT